MAPDKRAAGRGAFAMATEAEAGRGATAAEGARGRGAFAMETVEGAATIVGT